MSTSTRRRRAVSDEDKSQRRDEIMAAAKEVFARKGFHATTIADIAKQAGLAYGSIYWYFESKDELVAAVFVEMARVELLRLRTKMATAATPVEAVAAWIDGRFDLAFDENVKSDLRHLSLQSQSQVFASPELVSPAYTAILEPLIEQLQRGLEHGAFQDIVPLTAAKSIQGVVLGATQRQWATGHCEHAKVRKRALRFCLRGLGVAPETIVEIAARH